jgi:hypothetical protein
VLGLGRAKAEGKRLGRRKTMRPWKRRRSEGVRKVADRFGADPGRHEQFVVLAARYAIPVMYWQKHWRCISAGRQVQWAHPQRHETGGPAGRAVDEVGGSEVRIILAETFFAKFVNTVAAR